MKGLQKRIISTLLCVSVLLAAACGQGGADSNKKSKAGESAGGNGKGRYLESEVKLPENVEAILAMRTLEDGTIRMLSNNGIFDSKDNGKTFEPSKFQYEIQEMDGEKGYLVEAKLDSKGGLLLSYASGCRRVDTDGTETEIPIELPALEGFQKQVTTSMEENVEADIAGEDEKSGEIIEEVFGAADNFLMHMQFTEDGMLVGADMGGKNVYLIDPKTGEIVKTLCQPTSETAYLKNLAVVGNRLVVLTSAGIDVYDMESGKLMDQEPAFKNYFSGKNEEEDTDMVMGLGPGKVFSDGKEGIYYADETGFYHHTFGAGEMERLINGSLSSLYNPKLVLRDMVEKKDGGFLGIYETESGHVLKDYTYSKEVSAIPEKELKVYSLRDNQFVRQAIANFQTKYPDYYISLETGMSGDDAVTMDDAIKTLNTSIMSGNGPDLLITDDLPLNSYIEKGVLADTTEILEAAKKENAFFEKILLANQVKEKVYAIPMRFALPVLAGDKDYVQKIGNLSELAAALPKVKAANPDLETLIGSYKSDQLARFLLKLSMNNIWKPGQPVDEQALTAYLDTLKEIYALNGEPKEEEMQMSWSMGSQLQDIDTRINKDLMTILNGQQKLFAGTIQSLSDLSLVLPIVERNNWIYQPFGDSAERVFFPMSSVAINAKSERVEDAKEFLKFMLSTDAQASAYLPGLPVNRDALDQIRTEMGDANSMLNISGADGENSMFELRPGTKEEYEQFVSYLESASAAPDSNAIVMNAIVSAASECIVNGTDTAETVAAILKTVNLYLSE